MKLTKKGMPETQYRASRCCRIMGNPTAYLIIRCIGRQKKTPGELSEELEIPVATVSATLRHLRQIEFVRYLTSGKTKIYWLKDPEILEVLDLLEKWVDKMRHM